MNERSTEKGEHSVAASGVKVSVLGEVEHVKTAIGMLNSRASLLAENRRLREACQAVQAKCEQYWNEQHIGGDEIRAILEFIHREIGVASIQPAPEAEGAGT